MRYLLVSVIISIGIGLFGCKQEQNAGENTSLPQHVQVRNVIIDADTDNELDDLLAIAAALKSPKLEVIGMTAAQWMEGIIRCEKDMILGGMIILPIPVG